MRFQWNVTRDVPFAENSAHFLSVVNPFKIMGMDIIARKRRSRIGLHYNWAGWIRLVCHLIKWGVNTAEFSSFNNGERISADTCRNVAEAIDANFKKLSHADKEWLKGHAAIWWRMAKAGGCEQW